MVKVAFICIHNSCCSQIVEASGKYPTGDVLRSYSAGTETKPQISQDAVRLMKQPHGVDMEKTQRLRSLSELPSTDVTATAGCNVDYPYLPCKYKIDRGLDDPTGKNDERFVRTIKAIEKKIRELALRLISPRET